MSLRQTARDTLSILEDGTYEAPSGAVRSIVAAQQAAVDGTRLYTPTDLRQLLRAPHHEGPVPQLELRDATTQAVARQLVQDEGVERLVLLNFASARNPGGGFLRGAKAQEEDVTRCSGLYPCLTSQMAYYEANRAQSSMLYTDHVIYSPDVPFFRERNRDLLEAPFTASVITAPAPNAGQHLRRRPAGEHEITDALRRRAGAVLAICEEEGHRTLLLGAWGCGVFRNDPAVVAGVFDEWLRSDRFAGAFDRVVFGVIDGSKSQHVLRAFVERFGAPVVA
ncbi:MAG: TIGR02452 family protein [Myxococcales bacterium]|nr:TIGR02452 family protein [Myxococcales bacterium]